MGSAGSKMTDELKVISRDESFASSTKDIIFFIPKDEEAFHKHMILCNHTLCSPLEIYDFKPDSLLRKVYNDLINDENPQTDSFTLRFARYANENNYTYIITTKNYWYVCKLKVSK